MKIELNQMESYLDGLGIKLVDKHLLVPGQDNTVPARALLNVLGRSLPMNDMGDKIFAFYQFLLAHERQPTSEMLFNDVIHRKKVSVDLHDPLAVIYTDKELSKILIGEKLGKEHVVPTIDVLHNDMEIETCSFPRRCVIKPTHSTGRVVKKKIDDEVPQLKRWLKHNYYYLTREKNYRYLKPKIIVEPDLFEDPKMEEIKIFCFRGKAKTVNTLRTVNDETTSRQYTVDWDDLACSLRSTMTPHLTKKPQNFDAMKDAAELLARDFEFVRVDMYTNHDDFFLGEITQVHAAGVLHFNPREAEERVSKILFSD